jgi:hypothetical protein
VLVLLAHLNEPVKLEQLAVIELLQILLNADLFEELLRWREQPLKIAHVHLLLIRQNRLVELRLLHAPHADHAATLARLIAIVDAKLGQDRSRVSVRHHHLELHALKDKLLLDVWRADTDQPEDIEEQVLDGEAVADVLVGRCEIGIGVDVDEMEVVGCVEQEVEGKEFEVGVLVLLDLLELEWWGGGR